MEMSQPRLAEATDPVPSSRWSMIFSEINQGLRNHGASSSRDYNFEAGLMAARAISDGKLASCSEDQFWRKVEGYMTSLGWGTPELHYAKIKQEGCEIFTVLVNTSMLTLLENNLGATCDLIRGGIAGWLGERFGDTVTKAEETKCTAKGAAHCIFTFHVGERSAFSGFRRLFSFLI